MTLVQGRVVSLSSSDPIKMEERKRPASHDHDGSEPPLKRHATSVNGAPKSHIDADMPWKDDLEVSKPYHLRYPFSLPKRSQSPLRSYYLFELSLLTLCHYLALFERGYITANARIQKGTEQLRKSTE